GLVALQDANQPGLNEARAIVAVAPQEQQRGPAALLQLLPEVGGHHEQQIGLPALQGGVIGQVASVETSRRQVVLPAEEEGEGVGLIRAVEEVGVDDAAVALPP